MIQSTLSPQNPFVAERARAGELVGAALADALRADADLTAIDLTGANLDGADLSGLSMFKAKLAGATLRNADLSGVELSGADLSGADLERAKLHGAGLGLANLTNINAFGADFTDSTLTGADLEGASLGCANLRNVRLREANLSSADFRAAEMGGVELNECSVDGACFDEADLRGARLRAVTGFRNAHWYGVDIRDINFAGAYQLRRHIVDENYLREFRESGPIQEALYRVWWLTSDCGRSIGRWTVLIVAVATLFAGLFATTGVQLGIHQPGWMTHFYYSVVTLTTLGYGDILPNSSLGQVLVMLEVCVGYMMLGGLISIFANKMARRAD